MNPADRFRERLRRECEALGLELSVEQLERFGLHHQLLCRWAPKVNLTTVLEPEEAAVRHAADSLLYHLWLPASVPEGADLGSGAGFPGIPLAIMRPQVPWTLVEPIRKRTSFLRAVVTELDLARVRVVEGRVDPGRPLPAGLPSPAVVSRATWDPSVYLTVAARAVAPGGVLLCSSGRGAPEAGDLDRVAAQVGLVRKVRKVHGLGDNLVRVLDLFESPR